MGMNLKNNCSYAIRLPMMLGGLCLVSAALISCGKQEKAQTSSDAVTVKIGNVAPLTGPNAHLGKDNENGARLAVEEINNQRRGSPWLFS
jgi:branched-chain amino acid transport system substrate-binding protein